MPDDIREEGLRRGSASRALLSAALGGLLCAGAPSCSSKDAPGDSHPTLSDAGDAAAPEPEDVYEAEPPIDTGAIVDVVTKAEAQAEAEAEAPDAADAAPEAAALACDAMPEAGAVTSIKNDPSMTLEKFTAECNAKGGTFEIEPHCGGSNACMGMSYDTGTQNLTEHTCKGMNTCAGYSCVIC